MGVGVTILLRIFLVWGMFAIPTPYLFASNDWLIEAYRPIPQEGLCERWAETFSDTLIAPQGDSIVIPSLTSSQMKVLMTALGVRFAAAVTQAAQDETLIPKAAHILEVAARTAVVLKGGHRSLSDYALITAHRVFHGVIASLCLALSASVSLDSSFTEKQQQATAVFSILALGMDYYFYYETAPFIDGVRYKLAQRAIPALTSERFAQGFQEGLKTRLPQNFLQKIVNQALSQARQRPHTTNIEGLCRTLLLTAV